MCPLYLGDNMTTLLLLACLGITSVVGWSRIINGEDTDIQAHPHQVSLAYISTGQHVCGGSIISDFWVLTAAHCINNMNPLSDLVVHTNNGNLNDPGKKVFEVTEVIQHPNYNEGPSAYPHDVAVLFLKTKITDATHQAIALATSGDFSGTNCTITGWGKNENNVYPMQLQETTGIILTIGECKNWFGSGYNHAAHICIDNPTKGACSGDSGGPMVCNGLLAGVTSFGEAYCATEMPDVYARVTNYYKWIFDYIKAYS